MTCRRALFLVGGCALIAGFIWGAVFGRYVGYHQGNLDANRQWLGVVVKLINKKPTPRPPPPRDCGVKAIMPDDGVRVVNHGRMYTMSQATH